MCLFHIVNSKGILFVKYSLLTVEIYDNIMELGGIVLNTISNMLQAKTWAVIGASDNKQKFGYKIFKCLVDNGLEVYAVNPGVSELLGQKCYASIKDLPTKPEAVDIVVPPRHGEQIIRECAEAGIKNIWLQPGADSEELIKIGQQLGLNVVHHACIMVELNK